MYIHMKVMSNLHTHTIYTNMLSVLFGDVKFLAQEGKVEGRGMVLSKYESYGHIGIT